MDTASADEPKKTPPVSEIATEKVSVIALAGDLTGFSSAYVAGSAIVIEEFIRRFYLVCGWFVWHAGGELVKFTGDGFLAIWSIQPSDIRATSDLCKRVSNCASTLSLFLKISGLDLNVDRRIQLKLGIVIEANAIKISYQNDGALVTDYLGRMINFAFRILALPSAAPYVAAHGDFVEIQDKYPSAGFRADYKRRDIAEDEILRLFKGVREYTDRVYVWQYSSDDTVPDLIIEDLYKRSQLSKTEVANAKLAMSELVETVQIDRSVTEALFGPTPMNFQDEPEWFKRSATLCVEFIRRMFSLIFALKKAATKYEEERQKLIDDVRADSPAKADQPK